MSPTMTPTEPRKTFFQTAIYNFFALYLGVTPPAPGKEGFYATVLLVSILLILGVGYLLAHFLITQMLG